MLNETSDMVFKAYLTSKTQGWFWRRGRDEPAVTPAAPGAGAGGAGAATLARPPKMQVSDGDEDGRGGMSLMLPRKSSAVLFQARFRRWVYTP